jgi:hypothetical protein
LNGSPIRQLAEWGFSFWGRSVPTIDRIKELCQRLFPPKPQPPYDSKDEHAWYSQATAKEGIDYDELKRYADAKYVELNEAFDAIDKKAEWFFGIAFGSAGAAIVAFHSWKLSPVICSPSLACLFVAMLLAMRARMPMSRPTTMSVRDAISVAENDPAWKLRMIASTHCAVAGMFCVTNWKSANLQRAVRALTLSAFLFLLPVIVSHYSAADSQIDRSSANSGSGTAEHTARSVWQWDWNWTERKRAAK